MFAYCGNNPVIRYDLSGNRYVTVHLYDGGGYGGIIPETSVTNSTATVSSKLLNTLNLALCNIEFSAGIGQGIYKDFTALDVVGIGVGMYANYGTITYSDGKFDCGGQEYHAGITASVLGCEFGSADHSIRDSQGNEETSSFTGFNAEQDSLTIFSYAVYFYAGFSVYLGFDVVSFFTGLDEIWKG